MHASLTLRKSWFVTGRYLHKPIAPKNSCYATARKLLLCRKYLVRCYAATVRASRILQPLLGSIPSLYCGCSGQNVLQIIPFKVKLIISFEVKWVSAINSTLCSVIYSSVELSALLV